VLGLADFMYPSSRLLSWPIAGMLNMKTRGVIPSSIKEGEKTKEKEKNTIVSGYTIRDKANHTMFFAEESFLVLLMNMLIGLFGFQMPLLL
jgi:hypothetical protein